MKRAAVGVFAGVFVLFFAAGSATSASSTGHVKPRWRATVATLPPNTGSSVLWLTNPSISCASPGNCTAVGSYDLDSSVPPCGAPGLLLSETAGHWGTGVDAVLPANGSVLCPQVWLNSVSCPSPGNCVAVGSYSSTEGGEPGLLLTEKAGYWTAHEAALPANPDPGPFDSYVTLNSVSCASVGNCTAVGYYGGSGDGVGLLLTEKRGHWARGVTPPLPSDASGTGVNLSSVSCAADGSCSAVGLYDGNFPSRGDASGKPLLLTNAGGEWHAVKAVMPPDGPGEWAEVSSVSCASGGNCSAIGAYNIGIDSEHGPEGVLLTEKAGEWGRGIKAKTPKNAATSGFWAGYGELTGISCSSPGNCVTVGNYFDDHNRGQGMMVTEKAGEWRRGVRAALPRHVHAGSLYIVSCASPGNCTAAGYYAAPGGHGDAGGVMFLTETAGRWARGVKAPIWRESLGVFAISCASPGNCGVVGGSHLNQILVDGLLLDSSTRPCVVPRLNRETVATARRSLDSHGCAVGRIERARSRTIERGHVISQTRQPGRRLAPWTKIGLEVSKGP